MLTDEEVRYIRRNPYGFSKKALAKQFGISVWAVSDIIKKKSYRRVQPQGKDITDDR